MQNGVVVVHVPSRNVACYLMYGKACGFYWNKGPHKAESSTCPILGEACKGGHVFSFLGGGRGEGVRMELKKILLFQSCFHMIFLKGIPNSISFYFIAYPLPKVCLVALGFV
jgi:hypothetical protein